LKSRLIVPSLARTTRISSRLGFISRQPRHCRIGIFFSTAAASLRRRKLHILRFRVATRKLTHSAAPPPKLEVDASSLKKATEKKCNKRFQPSLSGLMSIL
jgi:hypothetical protein